MERELFKELLLALFLLQIPRSFYCQSSIPDCLSLTGFNLWCPHRLEGFCLGNATQSPFNLVCDENIDCFVSEVDEEGGAFNPGLFCKLKNFVCAFI